MVSTFSPSVTSVRFLQSSKELGPITFTLLGMIIDVIGHSLYQLFVDYQYFTFKKVEKWIYWFNLHS